MQKEEVQAAFGANAESYAQSIVHGKGASLARLVELVVPQPHWQVLDVATGSGHTAFTFAQHVERVWATDLTQEMLAVTEREARLRNLENVVVEYAEAEALPYVDASFELVTCRIAPHHFSDIPAFVRESCRVLKPGGRLAVVDNVVPDNDAGAYVNAFEKLRDPSHGRCLGFEEWLSVFSEAGFKVEAAETLRKSLVFSFWAQRHDAVMQSYLRSMLDLATGEAARFLYPTVQDGERVFHLTEGLFIGSKPVV